MGKGSLSMVIPATTVPGEIPIPVVFRYNASQAVAVVNSKSYTSLTGQPVMLGAQQQALSGVSPQLGGGYGYVACITAYDRPIFGTLDFGFISSNAMQLIPGTDVQYPGHKDEFTPPHYYVLEDGSIYADGDFSTMTGTFSLPPSFGFVAKAASAVKVNSSSTLATYPAVASDLGSTWSAKAAALAPVGFTTGTYTGYQVLMDRDRARVYAYATELNAWLPILWVDRFGHWVGLQWHNYTAGLPTGIAAVRTVTVKNHLGVGLQVQWAEPTGGGAAPSQTLVRADYINIQAPTVQITGHADLATNGMLSMLPIAAGPVVRPDTIQIGNPAMATPAWMQLPKPPATGSEAWPANDLSWSFIYTDSTCGELLSFTDDKGLLTALTWQNTTLVDPYAVTQGATTSCDSYRSVKTATATDEGVTLTRTWTWNLPATTSAPSWTTTYNQVWSGTQSWNGTAVGSADNPTTTYNYATPSGPCNTYGNGVATSITTATATTSTTRALTYKSGLGYDASYQGRQEIDTTTTGAPNASAITVLDPTTGALTGLTTTIGTYQDQVAYTYDPHPEFLDPFRCTAVVNSRFVAGLSLPNVNQKSYTYDPVTFLLTQKVQGAPTSGLGTNFAYINSTTPPPAPGYTLGHLSSLANFAAGGVFTSTGVATQAFTLDPTTGLPTKVTTTYDGPTGYTNSFAQSSETYDTANRPTSYVDGLGATVTIRYDARGRVVGTSKSGQAPVSITYPTELQVVTIKNGRTTTSNFDRFGRCTSRVRGGDGVTESYSYDENGQGTALKETSPASKSRTTSQTYDALGRLIQSVPIHGPMVTRAYTADGAGNQVITATYSGQAFTTSQSMDLWGHPVSSTDANATVTTRQYDGQGHVTTLVTTPSGCAAQTRTFVYNAFGLPTSKTEPETGTITYGGAQYNQLGQPLSIKENDGRTRTMGYDGMGRVRSMTNGTDTVVTNFNGLFMVNANTTSNGQSTSVVYTPDAIGRTQMESLTPPGAAGPWTISYGFDSVGRVGSITYPDNRVIGYGYDDVNNFGRVTSVLNNGATLATVSYDTEGWGNLGGLAFASGASNVWNYQPDGTQLLTQTITPVGAGQIIRNYGYDTLNHLNQAGEWSSLTHDPLGQLTNAAGMGDTIVLQHDGYGNNISSQAGGVTGFNNFTFNPFASDQTPPTVTSGAITAWTYDGDGEALTMGSAIGSLAPQLGFVWDKLGRLSTATLSGATVTYAYFPNGMRAQLIDSSNQANNRRFAYDKGGQLLAEYVASGSTWAWRGDVIYLGPLAIAEIDAAGTHELHSDHLGTPIVITSPQASGIQGSQLFGPYGEAIASPYPTGYLPMTGFTGHVQTEPNGLIYMRGRFYSPAWHRFLNSDQGADPNQLNQSAYVSGSPFMLADPLGLRQVDPEAPC